MKAGLPINFIIIVIILLACFLVIVILFDVPFIKAGWEKLFGMLGYDVKVVDINGPHKALHVKLDINNNELWEFHLSDDLKHLAAISPPKVGEFAPSPLPEDFFYLKSWEDSKCTIFTTGLSKVLVPLYPTGPETYPYHWIYYVNPGSLITTNSNTLVSDIISSNEGCEGVDDCSENNPSEFVICENVVGLGSAFCANNDDRKLKNFAFGTAVTDNCPEADNVEGACPASFSGGNQECCELLQTVGTIHSYKVKYGLICGYAVSGEENIAVGEANWWACTEANSKNKKMVNTRIGESNVVYKCVYNPTTQIGTWVPSQGLGLYITNAEIKYTGILEYETKLNFDLVNAFDRTINNVRIDEVKATYCHCCSDANADGSCNNDCCNIDNFYGNPVSCGNLGINQRCSFTYDNFCFGTTKFNVKVTYDGTQHNYELTCYPSQCGTGDNEYSCTGREN